MAESGIYGNFTETLFAVKKNSSCRFWPGMRRQRSAASTSALST